MHSTCVVCGRGNCGSYLEAGRGDMLTIGWEHMGSPRFSRLLVKNDVSRFGVFPAGRKGYFPGYVETVKETYWRGRKRVVRNAAITIIWIAMVIRYAVQKICESPNGTTFFD
jgi:hypothetical protein